MKEAKYSLTADKDDMDLKKKQTRRQMRKQTHRQIQSKVGRGPVTPEAGHRSRFYLSSMNKAEIAALNRLEERLSKSLETAPYYNSDSAKGGLEWAGQFYSYPKLKAQALRLVKEKLTLTDKQLAEMDKAGFSGDTLKKRDSMSAMERAKFDERRGQLEKKHQEECKNIYRQMHALEHNLIDSQITEAESAATSKSLTKATNTVDVDLDEGRMGIADYGASGQVAMRVQPNAKCNGCQHYDQNLTVCAVGLVPAVCGDGSFPEIGFSPVSGSRIAAKNWFNRTKDSVVTSTQAEDLGPASPDIPYRIDVLGDSALALGEKMDLVKSFLDKAAKSPEALAGWIWYHHMSPEKRMTAYKQHDPKAVKQKKGAALRSGQHRPPKGWFDEVKARLSKKGARKSEFDESIAQAMTDSLGFAVTPLMELTEISKSMDVLPEFAYAMGTTEAVVRDIARRLGDKKAFAEFIKSKLPDIMIAHGLDESGVTKLYNAAVKSMNNLSMTEWEAWKGVSFEDGVTDEALARAISDRGILDNNATIYGSILTPAEPPANLPEPEPLQSPEQYPINMDGFVGGNLHVSDSLTRRG